MRVTGRLVDADTAKPIPNAEIDIYKTHDMSGSPDEIKWSGADGTYDFSSSILDLPDSSVSVTPVGYHNGVGQSSSLNGDFPLYQLEITKVVKAIPWWAYVSIVVIVLGIIHFKYKKLF